MACSIAWYLQTIILLALYIGIPLFHPQPFLKLAFLLLLSVHAFEVAYCGARCLALGFTPLNSARWMVSVAANGVFSLSLMPAVRSKEGKKGD